MPDIVDSLLNFIQFYYDSVLEFHFQPLFSSGHNFLLLALLDVTAISFKSIQGGETFFRPFLPQFIFFD